MKKILASLVILTFSTTSAFSSSWVDTIDNDNIATVKVGDLNNSDIIFITGNMNPKTKKCFFHVLKSSGDNVLVKFNAKGVYEYVEFVAKNKHVECERNKLIVDGKVTRVVK